MDDDLLEPPEFDREQVDALREKGDELMDAARKIGLYAVDTNIGIPHERISNDDVITYPAIFTAVFTIGDVALSKRVQDPDTEEMDTVMAPYEDDAELDEVLDYLHRFGDGEIFDE